MTMNGTDGCQTWADAESALVKAADVVPFANNIVKTFGKGATVPGSRRDRPDQHPDARLTQPGAPHAPQQHAPRSTRSNQ